MFIILFFIFCSNFYLQQTRLTAVEILDQIVFTVAIFSNVDKTRCNENSAFNFVETSDRENPTFHVMFKLIEILSPRPFYFSALALANAIQRIS